MIPGDIQKEIDERANQREKLKPLREAHVRTLSMTVTPDLRKGILLMLISSICACLGQLLWKISADRGMLFVIAGFLLYGIGGLTMVVAYRFGRLSVLQPMMSLNYVLSILLAAFVLRENITLIKCIGVLLIIAGVVFIAGGDER